MVVEQTRELPNISIQQLSSSYKAKELLSQRFDHVIF